MSENVVLQEIFDYKTIFLKGCLKEVFTEHFF